MSDITATTSIPEVTVNPSQSNEALVVVKTIEAIVPGDLSKLNSLEILKLFSKIREQKFADLNSDPTEDEDFKKLDEYFKNAIKNNKILKKNITYEVSKMSFFDVVFINKASFMKEVK